MLHAAFSAIPKEAEPDVNIPIIYVSMHHDGISPEDAERLRPAVARWIAALPRSIEAIPAAPEDKLGLVTWDRLEACWAPMKGLYEDLIGTLPPDHPAIKVLRESTRCLVPIAPYD